MATEFQNFKNINLAFTVNCANTMDLSRNAPVIQPSHGLMRRHQDANPVSAVSLQLRVMSCRGNISSSLIEILS